MLTRGLVPALLLVGFAAGCQPKASGIPGPERPWKDMSRAEREVYMNEAVLPHMQATFQKFDPERFAEFDCTTCHRTGADRGDFAMPDPGLPELSRRNFYREPRKQYPELANFMWEHVDPQMRALLGNPKHFDCRSCHTTRR